MEVAIEIKAKPGDFQELDQTLEALLPTIRNEKGCRECRIYRDVEDRDIFHLSIQWESQANLGHYMRSANGMALLGAIELLSERAGVKIGHDAGWKGIDILKKIGEKTEPLLREIAEARRPDVYQIGPDLVVSRQAKSTQDLLSTGDLVQGGKEVMMREPTKAKKKQVKLFQIS